MSFLLVLIVLKKVEEVVGLTAPYFMGFIDTFQILPTILPTIFIFTIPLVRFPRFDFQKIYTIILII